MYVFFETPKPSQLLGGWQSIVGEFDLIKAYSALGDVFLQNSTTGEVGVLLTMAYGFHPMESYDWDSFREEVMENPNFQEDVMSKSMIDAVQKLCGPLGSDEVYVPTPYPAMGGSGAADTHKIGDLWVYLDVSSQMLLGT